jgi:glycosyltransferase involved in cell wall biosynthesis
MNNFKEPYTWPNEAFPFRVYFCSNTLTILLIENIQHNFKWMNLYKDSINNGNFVFLVYCGWHLDNNMLYEDSRILNHLGIDKSRFYILFNSQEEMKTYSEAGFQGELINHNCWLDEDGPMRPMPELLSHRKYNAVYVARHSPFKRHQLASSVDNLCLVMGNQHGSIEVSDLPPHTYRNHSPLESSEVAEKINQSACGLILSAKEGACFASSEYLLCGIPVVSTPSKGGRDFWYTDYNSLIVSPDPAEVSKAVSYFMNNKRNPRQIRESHVRLAHECRSRFITMLGSIFSMNSISVDPQEYYFSTYLPKLRISCKPDFRAIFSS